MKKHPESDNTFNFVKCCEGNDHKIAFNDFKNRFYFVVFDDNRSNHYEDHYDLGEIYRCPWCGILLDTNLLED